MRGGGASRRREPSHVKHGRTGRAAPLGEVPHGVSVTGSCHMAAFLDLRSLSVEKGLPRSFHLTLLTQQVLLRGD